MSTRGTEDRLEAISAESEDHGFTFDAHPLRVRVSFNGVTIADSENVRVLHEARLPPVFYFPRENLLWEHLIRTSHRTFCPFKGNASYWSIEASGRRAENAAWSYEDPLDEARHIEDHVTFYANLVDVVDESEEAFDEATVSPCTLAT